MPENRTSESQSRSSVIFAIKTPLSFFVLTVLVGEAGIGDQFTLAEQEIEIESASSLARQAVAQPLTLPAAGPATESPSAMRALPTTEAHVGEAPVASAPIAPPNFPSATPQPLAREAALSALSEAHPAAKAAAPLPPPDKLAAPMAGPLLPGEPVLPSVDPRVTEPATTALLPLPASPAEPITPRDAEPAAPVPVLAQPLALELAAALNEPAPQFGETEPSEPALRIEIGEITIRLVPDSAALPAPALRGAGRGASVPQLGDWLARGDGSHA